MNILNAIVANKKKEIAKRKKMRPLASFVKTLGASDRNFHRALKKGRNDANPRLIAEIKKASPSEGILRPRLETDFPEIVAVYNRYASAISVVTDERFFQGHLEWIKKIRALTNLPILCKDFIIDEYQIYEARNYGADSILLIASPHCVDEKKLTEFVKIAGSLGMSSLVEIHNEKEIKTALNAGAEIIGINNRNLETFDVSLEITLALAPLVPPECVIVSESGFKTSEEIKKMHGLADAVLIGTTFMKAKNIASACAKLFHC